MKRRRGGGGDAAVGAAEPAADVRGALTTARLRTRDALALGLLHGPAELLPISSSGHVARRAVAVRLALQPARR